MQAFAKGRRGRVLNDAGYYFNAEGELQQTKTVIVWGSPASGKTTYVLDHMETGDLVVDLDSIKQAISAQKKRNTPENLSKVAIGITEYLYGLIERGEVDCQTKWVIASLPDRKEREELARRLKAELVYMDAAYHECLRRVEGDNERGDKVQQKYFIDKWWERFEG